MTIPKQHGSIQPMPMPELTFERYIPTGVLTLYVEHFWTVRAPGEATPRREILIPNGRPMLLLSFASPSVRIDPLTGNCLANSNTLAGIATQPFVIQQSGESLYIGVQFKPYGLAAFRLGDKLVNQILPIEDWLGQAETDVLMERLRAHDFGQPRIEALEAILQGRAAEVDYSELEVLDSAIQDIQQAGGQVKVEELAQQSYMHPATFYRLFKKHLGIAPKQYLDIIRYYTFVGGLLRAYPNDAAALLDSMQGYYDQAHASKEFRRFTGVTPNTFRAALNNIAKLMHQVVSD